MPSPQKPDADKPQQESDSNRDRSKSSQHDRSSGKGNRNRNKNKSKHNSKGGSSTSGIKKVKFDGEIDDLKGNVFQCHSEGAPATQFKETCLALRTYSGINFKFGADIQYLIKNLKEFEFIEPKDPLEQRNESGKKKWTSTSPEPANMIKTKTPFMQSFGASVLQ